MIRNSKMAWASALLLVVAAFAVSAALYGSLPDPVPTHWGISGEADGFTAKPWGPFVLPLLMAGILALLAVLPAISPKGFDLTSFGPTYSGLTATVLAFLFALHAMATAAALDRIDMDRGFGLSFGAFFLVMGNWLPKVRRNFFMGIRTPWTLADEEVWAVTHRFGGRTMVAGGLVMMIAAIAGAPMWATIGILLLTALAPAAYSFFAYRSLHREA